MTGLEPGRWRVNVEPFSASAAPQTRDVDVRVGERTTLEF
jgi:hypothetical protein